MKALLMLNLQIDFCSSGMLAVPGADELIDIANQLMPLFDKVIVANDQHPADHPSFAANHLWRRPGDVMKVDKRTIQLWPMHCVAGSFGASPAPRLNTDKVDATIYKGMQHDDHGYNAFKGNLLESGTSPLDWLKQNTVDTIYIMGMCTEYSVFFTALAAQQLSFQVFVIADACRAIDFRDGDGESALQKMSAAGLEITGIKSLLKNV